MHHIDIVLANIVAARAANMARSDPLGVHLMPTPPALMRGGLVDGIIDSPFLEGHLHRVQAARGLPVLSLRESLP